MIPDIISEDKILYSLLDIVSPHIWHCFTSQQPKPLIFSANGTGIPEDGPAPGPPFLDFPPPSSLRKQPGPNDSPSDCSLTSAEDLESRRLEKEHHFQPPDFIRFVFLDWNPPWRLAACTGMHKNIFTIYYIRQESPRGTHKKVGTLTLTLRGGGLILSYELGAMARTCTNNLRVVLGP